jgi:hypothetical protein
MGLQDVPIFAEGVVLDEEVAALDPQLLRLSASSRGC